jgi:hypothetical protein
VASTTSPASATRRTRRGSGAAAITGNTARATVQDTNTTVSSSRYAAAYRPAAVAPASAASSTASIRNSPIEATEWTPVGHDTRSSRPVRTRPTSRQAGRTPSRAAPAAMPTVPTRVPAR